MADPEDVTVQVTYRMPAKVLRWAIERAHNTARTSGREDADHITAVLIALNKDAKVIEVHTEAA
jgi:hypothetical protein